MLPTLDRARPFGNVQFSYVSQGQKRVQRIFDLDALQVAQRHLRKLHLDVALHVVYDKFPDDFPVNLLPDDCGYLLGVKSRIRREQPIQNDLYFRVTPSNLVLTLYTSGSSAILAAIVSVRLRNVSRFGPRTWTVIGASPDPMDC